MGALGAPRPQQTLIDCHVKGPVMMGPVMKGPVMMGPVMMGAVMNGPVMMGAVMLGPVMMSAVTAVLSSLKVSYTDFLVIH